VTEAEGEEEEEDSSRKQIKNLENVVDWI